MGVVASVFAGVDFADKKAVEWNNIHQQNAENYVNRYAKLFTDADKKAVNDQTQAVGASLSTFMNKLADDAIPLFADATQVAVAALGAVQKEEDSQNTLLLQLGVVPPGSVDHLLQVYEWVYFTLPRHLPSSHTTVIITSSSADINAKFEDTLKDYIDLMKENGLTAALSGFRDLEKEVLENAKNAAKPWGRL